MNAPEWSHTSLESWLREEHPQRLADLFARADATRKEHVGDAVHLRGLVEISNHCVRGCTYCGLRSANGSVTRYRMTAGEIYACADAAQKRGYGTLVMQAGEDPALSRGWIADIVRGIKQRTSLAITLSLGERSGDCLAAWRAAGADRYLLRFETSDRSLYQRIHPPMHGKSDRVHILHTLRELGYEVGSGIMIGIPGQTYATIANDLLLFRALDLDMVGVGPFIAHPATPLGQIQIQPSLDQVPASEAMVYKVVALTRLLCPDANIPSTTALATINRSSGRELGLLRGANVVMPNLTPPQYRALYEIYPDKACVNETAEVCDVCLESRITRIGRTVAVGPGGRGRLVVA